ncbi:MAG TPA: VOC family protein [Candidatus Acidoferrales bacterium]|nr:VOC family protein [Candidatus Acidoferrales bacterium]
MQSAFRHVALFTRDPDRLFDFYQKHLGFSLMRRSPTASLYVTDGLIMYALLRYREGSEAKWVGYDHFGFHVSDMEEAKSRVIAAYPEARWDQRPRDGRYAEYRFYDWDGHPVDVSQEGFRTRNDLTPPTVRHVAIGASDPARSAAFYSQVFDLKELRAAADGFLVTDGTINLLFVKHRGPGSCRVLHMGLEVPDPESLASALGAKRSAGCGQAQIEDPDGNALELASSWAV